MDINLNAHYVAHQTDRSRLEAKAERGWVIEQAAAERPTGHGASSLRHWIGGLMILAGRRVQGMPKPALPGLQAGPSA